MNDGVKAEVPAITPTSGLIDWYAVGQGCEIEVGDVTVSLRVVGQKGRRTRIIVTASVAATFLATAACRSG